MIDLEKLQKDIDKVLSEETKESFNKWLEGKGYFKKIRTDDPARKYYVDESNDLLPEDDTVGAIKRATEKASQSPEAAKKFLQDAGISDSLPEDINEWIIENSKRYSSDLGSSIGFKYGAFSVRDYYVKPLQEENKSLRLDMLNAVRIEAELREENERPKEEIIKLKQFIRLTK